DTRFRRSPCRSVRVLSWLHCTSGTPPGRAGHRRLSGWLRYTPETFRLDALHFGDARPTLLHGEGGSRRDGRPRPGDVLHHAVVGDPSLRSDRAAHVTSLRVVEEHVRIVRHPRLRG